MLPRAAYIVTGTEAGKREIVRFYSPDAERVRVVPFPVTPFALGETVIPASVVQQHDIDTPYLFFPAQFWPHKNHVALLHALKLLRERDSLNIEVVFCGSDKGNLAHVRQTAQELGLENHVRFLGFVTREELYALYRNAFALVYPSMFGPDNLPPLEAFAIGCPVIAACVSGAVEQMGDAALLFDPRREEEIASAVLRLHTEPALKNTLVEKGRERALRWKAQDYLREIMAMYDEFELYRRCWSREKEYTHH
jgi:glycosyltransferase involved in cell wall biosynthesis